MCHNFSIDLVFTLFGFIFNILKKTHRNTLFKNYDDDELSFLWAVVGVLSVAWFLAIPVGIVFLVLFLLKLLTDKIADITLHLINKRKLKKQSKQEM